ncbi:ABC transporter permease [Ekhidna sp.]
MKQRENKSLRFANWVFSKFIGQSYLEEFLGDLQEIHEDRLEYKSRFYSSFMYWIDAFHLMFGFSSIRFFKTQNNTTMLKSYFKIAYRNMLKYKFYSAINVIGLSIGISMSLLIAVHVFNELGYETSYPKHKLIYRLASTNWAKKPPVMGTEFKEQMPEVKEVARLFSFGPSVLSHEKKEQLIERPFLGDPSMIEMFDLEFIEGTKDALDEPSTILLTESVANRLFKPGEKRLGEVVVFDDGWRQTVTGIIKDFPKNTHLKIDCISSSTGSFIAKNTDLSWAGVSVFALFESQVDVKKVEERLMDFHVQFYEGLAPEEQIRQEITESGEFLELHPIADIHLHSHREKEIEANSNVIFIYVFSALAVFILLVVIINFINLYVAQTLNRIKEIGLRKVMGAYRGQLIFQFLAEAFFLVLVSSFFAVGLAILSLPFYNELASIPITINELLSTRLLLMLGILILIVGSMAGGYPAFYLSRFGISEGLSSRGLKINSKLPLRTAMVAFQFLISICLLSATLIVSEQMNFIEAKDMGFAKKEIIAIKLHRKLREEAILSREKIRAELTKHANVEQVSFSSHLIGSRFSVEPSYLKSRPEDQLSSRVLVADPMFLETMGIEVVKGGLQTKEFVGRKFFLNETAVSLLQRENILGETVYNTWQEKEGEAVGIVKDFHFASLHNQVDPLIIQLSIDDTNALEYMLIRVKSKDLASTISTIEKTLLQIAPETLIVPQLVNEHMDLSYRAENSMFSIFKMFSSIIIGLACIGLFALFAFVVQARTKEMGIRKTLGATMTQLLLIMSKSYLGILVTIAIIAAPVVRYFSNDWLDSFAFRTTVNWWYYVLPGILVLTLAALAIVVQSWKVAKANPIESLKSE